MPGEGASAASVAEALEERAARYQGRAQSDVIQARAFAMVELARQGAGPALLPYVLEELGTAHHPYALAAAAKALTLITPTPFGAKDVLDRAAWSLGMQDRMVDLEAHPPRPGEGESARAIVQAAQRSLARKPCCSGDAPVVDLSLAPDCLDAVADLEMEDQDGQISPFSAMLRGSFCLVAFFYTRCGNPAKCSQTVSALGQTRRALKALGLASVRVFGVSYDPEFDRPARLRQYGQDRGLIFDASCRLLRARRNMARLQKALHLGVGYGPGTVNAHRLEWLLTGPEGGLRLSGARRHWDLDEIVNAIGPANAD